MWSSTVVFTPFHFQGLWVCGCFPMQWSLVPFSKKRFEGEVYLYKTSPGGHLQQQMLQPPCQRMQGNRETIVSDGRNGRDFPESPLHLKFRPIHLAPVSSLLLAQFSSAPGRRGRGPSYVRYDFSYCGHVSLFGPRPGCSDQLFHWWCFENC